VNAEEWGVNDRRRIATRDVPGEVLELVDRKQGGRFCVLCREQGLATPPEVPLVLDHHQPLSVGGTNHWSNLRWLCQSHNAGRRDRAGWRGRPAWERRREDPPC
jgi:HNH endonuclease